MQLVGDLALPSERLAAIFNDQVGLECLLIGSPSDQLPPVAAMAIYEFCVRTGCSLTSLIQALSATPEATDNLSPLFLLRQSLPLNLLINGSQLFWEL